MDESYSKEKWLLYHENAVYKAVTTAIEQSNNFVIKSKIVTISVKSIVHLAYSNHQEN